jgi:hypothetical protein
MNRTVTRALLALILTVLPVASMRPQAGAPPNRLDYNGGAVLANPAIHNLYMDFDWNSDNPAAISRGAIDGATASLVTSNYFAKASQYGVGPASFTGSHEAGLLPCPAPIIAGVTDFLSIAAWMECMTAPSPIPFTGTISGAPAPDDNTVYVVYVPRGTQINDIAISSCGDFGAYHFDGVTAVWQIIFTPLPVPVLVPHGFPYAVVPIDCAIGGSLGALDGVTASATHEIIEASTDPYILTGWIDNSKNLLFSGDILKAGEAGDICEPNAGDVPTPPVRLTNGLLVAPYWSNADNACVPITHPFHLGETGLPGSVPHEATFDSNLVALPFDTIVDDGTVHSYSFPTPVNDPSPGIRYVTSEPPATITALANFSKTAAYTTEYFLSVQAVPAAASVGDLTLTLSSWRPAGSTAALQTDPIIPVGSDQQFRFDHWSGDVFGTAPSTSVFMSGPKNAVANYVSQHLLTVNTNGLGANNTRILNGSTVLGTANDFSPLVLFVDDGPLALNADADVSGSGGVQYFFQRFAPAPPGLLAAAFTTTANYKTMAQLIDDALASGGIYGPGASGLANSYRQQFAAVEADIAASNYAQALLDLQSFISHVQAQAGKHVTPALGATLQLDALLVYHDAICQALGLAQIDAATAAADYVFYSALESILGGTILPPC